LTENSAENPALVQSSHSKWENSYVAAHDANLLSESIQILTDKIQALSAYYAEQEIKWREIDAIHEGHRRYEEQREEQIKFKTRVNEDARRDSVNAANTIRLPSSAMASGAMVWGRSGVLVATDAAVALERAIISAANELGRIAAIRLGQTVSVGVTALFYSPELGNGELSPEQRRRLFQGVGTSAQALGLPANTDLRAIASAGGSVELPHKIKAIRAERGTELHLVTTGGAVPASVPVIQAVFDPLSNSYKAQTSGSQPKYLEFASSSEAMDASYPGAQPELFTTEPQMSLRVSIRVSTIASCASRMIRAYRLIIFRLPAMYRGWVW
jgi:hypothetical protein